MLVLSRRIGERIIIDNRITVEVIGITSGGRVRLGLSAPSDVVINREEVADRDRDTLSDPDHLGLQMCS